MKWYLRNDELLSIIIYEDILALRTLYSGHFKLWTSMIGQLVLSTF